jgi:hypothetical protein
MRSARRLAPTVDRINYLFFAFDALFSRNGKIRNDEKTFDLLAIRYMHFVEILSLASVSDYPS